MKIFKIVTLLFACCVLQEKVLAQGPMPLPPTVFITEIMYNPPESGTDTLEFIEIRAIGSQEPSYDLSGHYFSSGINFTFPDGFILLVGEFAIIAKDSIAFENTFGIEAFQWNNSSLLNTGEAVTIQFENFIIDSVFYGVSNPWSEQANGNGASLSFCGGGSNNDPNNWQASENNTGIIVNGITIYADPGETSVCTLVSIEEPVESKEFRAYPNPSNGGFRLLFSELENDAAFSIHDSKGSLIHSETVVKGLSALEKQMNLASGLYWLQLVVDGKYQTQYLMIAE